MKELSERFWKSVATIKRRLQDIRREWVQPSLSVRCFVHLDVTYWGRSFGVLLALDNQTGKPLYMAFVKSETVEGNYPKPSASIKERGYTIADLIIDVETEPVQIVLRVPDTDVPVPPKTGVQTLSDA